MSVWNVVWLAPKVGRLFKKLCGAAGLVKGDCSAALPVKRGDHTLCQRAIRATWGVQVLEKQSPGL
jgi:hypothetical protein